MRKLFFLFLLFPMLAFGWGADHISKEYEGIGDAAEATYATGDSSNTTSACDAKKFKTVIAYISVSAVSGSGKVKFLFEVSPDNSNWYDSGTNATLTQVGDTIMVYDNCARWFRLKGNFQSGTSITVDIVQLEAKS